VDFYILARSLIYLFLTISHPTTLVFDEPVEYVSVGKEGEFALHRANNQKILVVQPLKEFSETDMIVITKDHHFQFKVRMPESKNESTHAFVYIHDGDINRSYVLKFENADLKILDGDSSTLIQNKTSKPIIVNEKVVDREAHFSKGIPFIVNNQRILN
jgi:redox-sensitive bicupin YhaK (pirin superfamily)